MINLKLKAQFDMPGEPYVVKLIDGEPNGNKPPPSVAIFRSRSGNQLEFESEEGRFSFSLIGDDKYAGDVVLCLPDRGIVERLFRANSRNNTLLFTERCDQLCVMCSQPPREIDSSWRLPLYEDAVNMVVEGATIGISGGEPMLYKNELFGMLERVGKKRPDISFHILSNGQHFELNDREILKAIHARSNVLWGIPLYASTAADHDLIVGKQGAFNIVMEKLFLLASTGAAIELRTVLMGLNALDLPGLANFISKHLMFIARWAIMATEPIGYAKANKHRVFYDHSIAPQPLSNTLDICAIWALVCTRISCAGTKPFLRIASRRISSSVSAATMDMVKVLVRMVAANALITDFMNLNEPLKIVGFLLKSLQTESGQIICVISPGDKFLT